jgi:hypothetical protein
MSTDFFSIRENQLYPRHPRSEKLFSKGSLRFTNSFQMKRAGRDSPILGVRGQRGQVSPSGD